MGAFFRDNYQHLSMTFDYDNVIVYLYALFKLYG